MDIQDHPQLEQIRPSTVEAPYCQSILFPSQIPFVFCSPSACRAVGPFPLRSPVLSIAVVVAVYGLCINLTILSTSLKLL